MTHKKIIGRLIVVLILVLVILACRFFTGVTTPTVITEAPATPIPTNTPIQPTEGAVEVPQKPIPKRMNPMLRFLQTQQEN